MPYVKTYPKLSDDIKEYDYAWTKTEAIISENISLNKQMKTLQLKAMAAVGWDSLVETVALYTKKEAYFNRNLEELHHRIGTTGDISSAFSLVQ